MDPSRVLILHELCSAILVRRARTKLLTEEFQRATKCPEPKATSPSSRRQSATLEARLQEAAI